MSATIRGIIYEALCDKGSRIRGDIDRDTAETRRTAHLLANAEEHYYTQIPHYQAELAKIKAKIDRASIVLQRHVAHCTNGCKRATDGTSFAVRAGQQYARAPHHSKPEMPGASTLAAMLAQGQTLDGLAVVYDRHPHTIRDKVVQAGYSAVSGRPNHRKPASKPEPAGRPPLLEQPPWMADALCPQTDPEAFFPEKGGSARAAKAVCARCPVATECLDWALGNQERHGIYGGLSERERHALSRQQNVA